MLGTALVAARRSRGRRPRRFAGAVARAAQGEPPAEKPTERLDWDFVAEMEADAQAEEAEVRRRAIEEQRERESGSLDEAEGDAAASRPSSSEEIGEQQPEEELEEQEEEGEIDVSHMQRSGQIAVVGVPNAGKSTLVNALVGAKVSIVTHKPQTTRQRVMGLALLSPGPGAPLTTQAVFVDTAGVFDTQMKKIEMEGTRRKGYFKQTRMLKAAVKTAWSAVRTSDVVFWVIDAWKLPSYGGHLPDVPMLDGIPIGDPLPFAWWSHPELMDEMYLIQRLSSRKKKVPVQVVLNKMDLVVDELGVDPDGLVSIVRDRLNQDLGTLDDGTPIVQNIWPTSALTDDSSLDPIRTWLCENLPEQSPIFPLDSVSDVSAKVIAAEITREWLFKDARAEVPYQTNVVTVIWKELENGTLKLGQKVIVRKKSHALICKGVLRKINRDVEQETSETLNFGRPVELHFQISVEPDWENNPVYYDEVQGILSQTASLQYK